MVIATDLALLSVAYSLERFIFSRVRWFQKENQHATVQPVTVSDYVRILDNGTLVLYREFEDHQAGLYWCEATNSVGTTKSDFAELIRPGTNQILLRMQF